MCLCELHLHNSVIASSWFSLLSQVITDELLFPIGTLSQRLTHTQGANKEIGSSPACNGTEPQGRLGAALIKFVLFKDRLTGSVGLKNKIKSQQVIRVWSLTSKQTGLLWSCITKTLFPFRCQFLLNVTMTFQKARWSHKAVISPHFLWASCSYSPAAMSHVTDDLN